MQLVARFPGLMDGVALGLLVGLAAVTLLLIAALCLRALLAPRANAKIGKMEQVLQSRLTYAENQAAQSRDWLLMSEQIAHVGHWRIGFPAYELFWSDEIYRIHGVSPEFYTPEIESAMGFFHPDDREMVASSIEKAVRQREKYEWVARLRRPDGEIRHVLSRGILQLSPGGEVIGLFGVFIDVTEQKLIEEELRLANQAAVQANLELHALALMDSLSGLPNRRQFDVAIAREFKRAHREDNTLALLMIDLDYFKAYNDHYGHLGGDNCLRRVAAVIAQVPMRPGDQAARYGGEEFAMLLPETSLEGAMLIAERMAAAVRDLRLEHRASPLGYVTISCGVAAARPRHDTADVSELIGRADAALYQAKRFGRDRACQTAEDGAAALAG